MSPEDRGSDWADSASSEEVEFGSSAPPRRVGLPTIAAGIVAAVVVLVVAHGRQSPTTGSPPSSAAAQSATPAAPGLPQPAAPRGPARAAPLVDSGIKSQLLGITAGWNLFARTPDVLVRLEFARRILTRTAVPTLQSSGPVSFVVGPQGAIVRPLDFVPGYFVPDGHFARTLPVALRHGGPVIPGPNGGVWIPTGGGGAPAMSLVDRDGHRTGLRIRLPPAGLVQMSSDGNGYLLLVNAHGVYDARPSGRSLVTTGHLLAVGSDRLLTVQCEGNRRCVNQFVNPATGSRRNLARVVDRDAAEPTGVISPNGNAAALPRTTPNGAVGLRVVDLRTGADTHVPLQVSSRQAFSSEVAWSPDGKWLFAATTRGDLVAVNARTGRIRQLRIAPPDISQIVVRPTQP